MPSPKLSTSKEPEVIELSSGAESEETDSEKVDESFEVLYDGPPITPVNFATSAKNVDQQASKPRTKRKKKARKLVAGEVRNFSRFRQEIGLPLNPALETLASSLEEEEFFRPANSSSSSENGSLSSPAGNSPNASSLLASEIPPAKLTFSEQIIKITDSAYWLLLTQKSVVVAGFTRISCFAGNPEIAGFRMAPSTKTYVIPSLDCESLISIYSISDPIAITEFVANASRSFDMNSLAMKSCLAVLSRFPDQVRSILLLNSTNSISDPLLWNCVKLFPNLMPKTPEFSQNIMELQRVPSTATRKSLFPGCCLYAEESTDLIYIDYQYQTWTQIRTALEDLHSKWSRPVILLCGGKNVGKSTSVRFIINYLLRHHAAVQCLDCDVGQSEFNPPGCIAIHTFNEPVLGPPFSRLHEPEASLYTADVTPARQIYLDGLRYVFDAGRNSQVPLVVNTMGWIEKLGLDLLQSVCRLVCPNLIIELHRHPSSTISESLERSRGSSVLNITTSVVQGIVKDQFTPAFRRKMSLIAYLSRISPDLGPVNNVTPYQVKFSDVFIHFTDAKLPSSHFLLTLLGAYVGLSKWDSSQSSASIDTIANLKIVRQLPIALNIGFGIVRAIDPEKSFFYVLTPLEKTQLEKCNLIIRGAILTPDEIFLGQDLNGYEGLVPRMQYRYAFEE